MRAYFREGFFSGGDFFRGNLFPYTGLYIHGQCAWRPREQGAPNHRLPRVRCLYVFF